MSAFTVSYTDEQRDAVARAYVPRKVTAEQVSRAAAAGALVAPDGHTLQAFEIPANTVRHIARVHRRDGTATADDSALVEAPPRDAIEKLRRRLIAAADEALRAEEAKAPGKVDAVRVAQIARVVREASSLPGPNDPRPPAPGQKVNGVRDGGATRGGLGGRILEEHRQSVRGVPVADVPDVPELRDLDLPAVTEDAEPKPDPAPKALRQLAERFGVDLDAGPSMNGR